MKKLVYGALIAYMASTMAVTGCDGDDGNGEGGAGGIGGAGGAGGNGGAGGDGGGTGEQTALRVAHMSQDAGAVDFCVSADQTWTGPILAELYGNAAGLMYGEVTETIPLEPGTYTIRLVAPGAQDCTTPLAGLSDVGGVQVEEGSTYTAVAMGEVVPMGGAPAFRVQVFRDQGEVMAGNTMVRVIHASPDAPAVDIGEGMGDEFSAVFSDIEFGEAGVANGSEYASWLSGDNITLVLRPTGTDTDVLTAPVDFQDGGISTVFVRGYADGSPEALQLVVCQDDVEPVDGLTQCLVTP